MNLNLSESKVKRNMILGTLYKGISMVISFMYVPIVLACLGEVKYGIWTTILNILSWISHFDVGIGNGLRNKLVDSMYNKQDENSTRKFVSSAYIMLSGIIFLVILVFIVFSFFINWDSLFGVKEFDENLRFIMQLCVFFIGINFILSLCKSIYYAIQENSTVGLMGIIQQTIMLLGVFVLFKCKSSMILYVALLYSFSEIIVSIVFTVRLFKKSKDFIPSYKFYSAREAKETTNLGLLFFVSQMASLVLFSTDNLIISHFIGPTEVTSYSIVNKLFTVGTGMFVMLVSPYWSRTTAAKAKGDYKMIKNGMTSMYKMLVLGIVGAISLAVFFKPIATLWLQKELFYPTGLIGLMMVYSIIYMWNAIYSQIVNGLSMMSILVPVAILQGVANIPLSLMFLKLFNMGSVGVLLGTVLSTLISAIVTPIYVHREIKVHIINER